MGSVDVLKNSGINVEKSLDTIGNIALYNDNIEAFVKQSDEKLNNILKYRESNDMVNYALCVQNLKNEASYLGFSTLAIISYNHEVASKTNNIEYIIQNFNQLVNEFNRIVFVCKQYIEASNTSLKGKILVVDDSIIITNFVKKIFKDEYEVLTAENGNKAIEIVNTCDVSCMLLDLNMPECNGFEVLEYFKTNNLFKKVPVSLLTGDDAKESIQNAFKYPIVDMVSKPFSEKDVKAIVEKMISIHNFN